MQNMKLQKAGSQSKMKINQLVPYIGKAEKESWWSSLAKSCQTNWGDFPPIENAKSKIVECIYSNNKIRWQPFYNLIARGNLESMHLNKSRHLWFMAWVWSKIKYMHNLHANETENANVKHSDKDCMLILKVWHQFKNAHSIVPFLLTPSGNSKTEHTKWKMF